MTSMMDILSQKGPQSSPTLGGWLSSCRRTCFRNPSRAITRDPENYHEPGVFNPDRFLDAKDNYSELDPNQVIYGYGRRYERTNNT